MCASHSQKHWTAALIGDHEVTLWSLAAGEMLHHQSIARAHPSPEQDLSAALHQAQVSKSTPVLVCGLMSASSTVAVPAKPGDLDLSRLDLDGWQLQALPGFQQQNPTGLMQHGNAQIAGFLALNPKWDGVICLPGEVTHWVQVSAAEVVSFQSTLTTGLYSTLASSLALPASWSESVLAQAVADTMSRPERLASRLAELRASLLVADQNTKDSNKPEAAGLLWGYLLGAELAAARAYWLGQNMALIAPDHLASPYLAALAAQGLPVTQAQPDRMALEGLKQAWRRSTGTSAST
ncbi:2-dehydro-3-deoxygalactonokinase [Pseudophaeobacter sp.]|uniref:2-dehydro-3-deoxygalactonokinase n=1 Tax=Pseudophaeobacter sp. TaxID=1971739 RepID=UPI003297588E